jgi:hypothetical protein
MGLQNKVLEIVIELEWVIRGPSRFFFLVTLNLDVLLTMEAERERENFNSFCSRSPSTSQINSW